MHSYLIFPPLAKPSHRKPHAGNGHHTDTQVAQTDLTAVLQSINQAGCGGSRISPSVSYIVGGSEARANSWPWMVCLKSTKNFITRTKKYIYLLKKTKLECKLLLLIRPLWSIMVCTSVAEV